jgi:C1A family cysteine protease
MFKSIVILALICTVFGSRDFAFEKFMQFIHKYDKVYSSPEEFKTRFDNFKNNLIEILAEDSFEGAHIKGITKFSDMTIEEFKKTYLNLKAPANQYCQGTLGEKSMDAPESKDWRKEGKVSPIKDQRSCGSCWAFSLSGFLESQALIHGKAQTFSEQQLVDCSPETYGCDGGWPELAMNYWAQNGVESDAVYKYTGRTESCKYDASKVVAKVSNVHCYENISNEEIQSQLANVGPLSIVLDANDFFSYSSGVLKCRNNTEMNHAVLLVGYTQDSWIVKNSWGKNWGESGYVRMSNVAGQNCGVGTYIVTSNLQ